MKKFIITICAIFITCIARADTIDINWHVGDSIYDTSTCTVGGDVILPTAPTKRGYTFNGWKLKYTPIEYLESTGIQWIDTGIIPTVGDIVTLDGAYTVANNTIFGCDDVSVTPNLLFQVHSGSLAIGTRYVGNGADTNRHVYVFNTNNMTVSKDGQLLLSSSGNLPELSIFLFSSKIKDSSGIRSLNPASAKIYKYSVERNNNLIQDFIPVLDKNGVACMFDKVSGQFFYNAGTGDFIAGPVITE